MDNIAPKLGNRHIIAIIVLLAAILVIGGLWWWIRAGRIVSTDDARVKGTIVAVSAKINGRVEKVLTNEGDNVQAGQRIAIIEEKEFQAQVEQAKANLSMSEAKLAVTLAGNRPQEIAQAGASVLQTRANMENARKNSERDEILYQKGAISVQQRDASKTAYDIAKAQFIAATEQYSLSVEGFRQEDILVAQAQVRLASAALKNAEIQLADTTITAPVSGVIAIKAVEPGEIVAFGQQLFNITNLADVWIGANIEETYIGRVKLGQHVEFTVDAYPGKKFTGQVIEVGPASRSQFALLPAENSSANFTKVTQRLPIKIKAADSEYVLKPGMSAVIDISTK